MRLYHRRKMTTRFVTVHTLTEEWVDDFGGGLLVALPGRS